MIDLLPPNDLSCSVFCALRMVVSIGRVLDGGLGKGGDSTSAEAARSTSAFVLATRAQRATERRLSRAVVRGSDRLPPAIRRAGVCVLRWRLDAGKEAGDLEPLLHVWRCRARSRVGSH